MMLADRRQAGEWRRCAKQSSGRELWLHSARFRPSVRQPRLHLAGGVSPRASCSAGGQGQPI